MYCSYEFAILEVHSFSTNHINAHLCFGGGLSHLQGTVAHIGGGGGEGSGRADEEGGDRELHGCCMVL